MVKDPALSESEGNLIPQEIDVEQYDTSEPVEDAHERPVEADIAPCFLCPER